mmetsp:Transcript_18075/g.43196  ORF Transcript_18075/g.43196 Transcript_18075/m.43196 type:complete len:237 (+) Transcript_18075:5401-6111(+)
MLLPMRRSISWSESKNGTPIWRAICLPTLDLPPPGMPTSAITSLRARASGLDAIRTACESRGHGRRAEIRRPHRQPCIGVQIVLHRRRAAAAQQRSQGLRGQRHRLPKREIGRRAQNTCSRHGDLVLDPAGDVLRVFELQHRHPVCVGFGGSDQGDGHIGLAGVQLQIPVHVLAAVDDAVAIQVLIRAGGGQQTQASVVRVALPDLGDGVVLPKPLAEATEVDRRCDLDVGLRIAR